MVCPLCGLTLPIERAQLACGACPIPGPCGGTLAGLRKGAATPVRCPRCAYTWVEGSSLMTWARRWGHRRSPQPSGYSLPWG